MPPYADTRNVLDCDVEKSSFVFRKLARGQVIYEALNQHVAGYEEFKEIEHWGRGCGYSYFSRPKQWLSAMRLTENCNWVLSQCCRLN